MRMLALFWALSAERHAREGERERALRQGRYRPPPPKLRRRDIWRLHREVERELRRHR